MNGGRERGSLLKLVGVRQLFLGAVLIIAIAPATQPIADPDFFWHLQVGRWIIDHGAIPHHDLFTYTVPDHVFVAHEWLSEVIMASLLRFVGSGAVAIYFGVVTWLAFLGLLLTSRKVPFVISGSVLALGVIAGNPIWGPRTQMTTFAMVVGLLLLLRRYRETEDRRWLYPIPPMFLVWVNLHAGFTVGLVFLATTVAGELLINPMQRWGWLQPATRPVPLRPLMAVFGLAVLAAMANPNFASIYVYAAQTQFSPAQQKLIVEWFSPNFHLPETRPFELMLLLLPVLLALSPRRPRLTDMLLLLLVVALALQSVRHIALFIAVATPILAELAGAAWEQYRAQLPRLRLPRPSPALGAVNLLLLALVCVLAVAFTAPHVTAGLRSKAIRSDYPVAAIDAIGADLPPGRMFNQYGWGGYLVYRAWPQTQVYIYGDAAVMGDSFLDEYESIAVLRPDFRQRLERRSVTWVIFPTTEPLTVVLRQSPDWVSVYNDSHTTVLVRRSPATAAYLARHS